MVVVGIRYPGTREAGGLGIECWEPADAAAAEALVEKLLRRAVERSTLGQRIGSGNAGDQRPECSPRKFLAGREFPFSHEGDYASVQLAGE
jgi:hypothetical protein